MVTSKSSVRRVSGARRTKAELIARLLIGVLLLGSFAACSSDDEGSEGPSEQATDTATGTTLKVPEDFPTIGEAVAEADEGALILIGPGTYNESVTVETKNLVLRGTDRNEVIIDGQFERENGILVLADGVAVENLTVRNNTKNGVYFTGNYDTDYVLSGYRTSYVTAYNNGLYGIYAFNAAHGQIDHSYGSGHPDSAFYIGQCQPCDAVIIDSVAENNMLGYSGTNSGGDLIIARSVWRNNRAGIVPNSLNSEKLAPQRGTTIVANLVEDNNSATAPNNEGFALAFGNGIVLGGGSDNVVKNNSVRGHQNVGVLVTDLPENFKPENNAVEMNTLASNRVDLAYLTTSFASEAFGNCFKGNTFSTSSPASIETEMPCEGTPGSGWDLGVPFAGLVGPPPNVDYKTILEPAAQESMPGDPENDEASPATDVPMTVDIEAVEIPDA